VLTFSPSSTTTQELRSRARRWRRIEAQHHPILPLLCSNMLRGSRFQPCGQRYTSVGEQGPQTNATCSIVDDPLDGTPLLISPHPSFFILILCMFLSALYTTCTLSESPLAYIILPPKIYLIHSHSSLHSKYLCQTYHT
jgi:hypothetical protein